MKHGNKAVFYIFWLLLLSGCATVLLTGASGGVAYTITNVASKTLISPIDQVEYANRLALLKMKIRYIERRETENGVQIIAETNELNIYIDLKQITPKTTKIGVNAEKNIILKDRATAVAIIEQTEAMLGGS
ncbi:hypothetical protein NBG4_60045 [Candidatus Sulfobium mesophilum]|uniref:Lipoprotein n=1 Tax=Candidatus Sulfobium mesophilum TaxID=2016548 RepID=A0A2U3QJM1_9BACT|nr:hypothetical protein NBG4_60045 [Candidatus Sulfobium mesophilum]